MSLMGMACGKTKRQNRGGKKMSGITEAPSKNKSPLPYACPHLDINT